jgi:hypothetical protein
MLYFLVPLAVALLRRNYIGALFVCVVIVTSSLFHIYKPSGEMWWFTQTGNSLQQVLLWLDTLSALALIGYNLFTFYRAGWPASSFVAIGLAIVAFVPFFWPSLFGPYDSAHTVWHVAGSIITILAFLI